jgi:1,4-dihydroxy-2-naphthoate octaprenyltransferase
MMNRWLMAARPKTLAAVLCPIALASAMAYKEGSFQVVVFIFTLITGLGIQISTNYCNDLFDFIKGADTQDRKGPKRITQSELISVTVMKKICLALLIFTLITGLVLVYFGGAVIALLVALSLILAVAYTAGPLPLAYKGLGDIFVFIFFGPVATLASFYLQTHTITFAAGVAGIALGALSTAILAVNNLRDIEEDGKAGKRTLVVRYGISFGKVEYVTLMLVPLPAVAVLATIQPWVLVSLAYLVPAAPLMRGVMASRGDEGLNALLGKTGALLALFSLLFLVGWLL